MAENTTAQDANKYEQERQRLAKLWDAYEKQEKEIAVLKDKVAAHEAEMTDRERIIRSLKDVLETRDRRTRELEIELTSLRGDKTTYEPKITQLTNDLRIERERFAKLFALAEELDEELKDSRKHIEVRDDWHRTNVDVFANLQRALEERERMITSLGKRSVLAKPALDRLK